MDVWSQTKTPQRHQTYQPTTESHPASKILLRSSTSMAMLSTRHHLNRLGAWGPSWKRKIQHCGEFHLVKINRIRVPFLIKKIGLKQPELLDLVLSAYFLISRKKVASRTVTSSIDTPVESVDNYGVFLYITSVLNGECDRANHEGDWQINQQSLPSRN